MNAKNVTRSGLSFSDVIFIDEDKCNELGNGTLLRGDIVLTTRGTVGNLGFFDESVPFDVIRINSGMVILRGRNKAITPRFLYYALQAPTVEQEIKVVAFGSAQPQLTVGLIQRLPMAAPSSTEQYKIGSFLQTLDTKIAQLKKKKDLLERYKSGCMKSAFGEEADIWKVSTNKGKRWPTARIGEVLTIGSGRDYKHLPYGDVPVYGTGGLMTTVSDYLHDGESVCIGRKGTIDAPMFLTGKFWTVDTLFYTHSYRRASPRYVYYAFQAINWQLYNEATGVPSLSKSTIEKIQIALPTDEEQRRLCRQLTGLDFKIQLVSMQLATLSKFKRGLLQSLFS